MIKISVCIGSACHLKGSYNVIKGLQQAIEANGVGDSVEIAGTFCLNHCGNDVSVQVNGEYFSVDPEKIDDFFKERVLTLI